MISIYNAETDELIVREMNAEELAELEQKLEQTAKMEQEKLEQIQKREALLQRLGITDDEAKLLLG